MATPCRDDQLICLKKDLTEAIDTLPKSIAGKSTEKLENVESTLERWISNIRGKPGQGDYWVYHLEDSSKRKDLSDGLAADDLARLRYLQGLESKHQFNVFGAQVQKKVIGTRRAAIDHRAEECPGSEAEDEDEDEDEADAEPDTGEDNVCEINWTIQVTFGINGGRKTNILDLNPDNILQDDCFKGYKPDEDNVSDDDYDEPAHPDECTYIQYYRSLALLMVPQLATASLLLKPPLEAANIVAASGLLEYFASKCNDPQKDGTYLEILHDLCVDLLPQQNVEKSIQGKFTEYTIGKILEAAIRVQSLSLFEIVCNNIEIVMSPQFFPWIAAKLQDSTLPLVKLSPVLDRSVLAQGTLIDRYKFALDLNATDDRAPKGLREILFSTLDKVVYDCYTSTLYEQDGETLVFMACDRQDYDWLLRKLGPLLYKKRENFAFVMGFVWQFHVSARQDKLDVNDSFAFLKSTVRSLITRLDITRLVSVPGFQRWQQKRADAVHHNRGIIPPPPPPITSETLSNLCTILLDLDMQGDMDNLMRRLTEQSKTIDLAELFDLYLSFSRNLIDILAKRSKPFEDPVYSDLFRAVIFSLWNIYVGEAPAPEPALNLLHCGCWFCRDLHTFLTGPGEARGGFTFREYTIAAHADQVLHYAYSRGYCHYSRQQSGKTATWTVSKIPTKYENAKQNWDRRAEFARTQLRLFDQRQLSLLLGGDFSRIMGVPPPPEKPISIASSSPGYASAPEDPVPEDPQPDREQSQPPTGSRSPSAHVSSDRSSSTVPTPAISVQSPDTSSQMDNQTDTAPLPASSEQAALTPTSQNSGPDSGSGSSRYYSPPSVAGQKRKHPDDDTPTNSPSPSEEP